MTSSRAISDTSHVIASRERPALLTDAVESILEGDRVPSELIIVDQSRRPHPTLPSLGPVAGCEIRYVSISSHGLSRGRNVGVAESRSPMLSFTDDDIVVARDWFARLIDQLQAGGPRTVVTGKVAPLEAEQGLFVPSTIEDEQRAEYRGRVGRDVLFAGNMAMYRAAVVEVGPFDPLLGAGSRFPSAEDNDFGHRLLEAGYRIVYVPEAVVYHRAWRRTRNFLRLRWSYGRGQGAFFAKHLRGDDSYMRVRLRSNLLDHLGRIRGDVRARPLVAAGNGIYVAGVLSGAAEWLLTQRRPR